MTEEELKSLKRGDTVVIYAEVLAPGTETEPAVLQVPRWTCDDVVGSMDGRCLVIPSNDDLQNNCDVFYEDESEDEEPPATSTCEYVPQMQAHLPSHYAETCAYFEKQSHRYS